MRGVLPPADFNRVTLDIVSLIPGRTYGRIHRKAYPDPLSVGKTASRFSDPRRRIPAHRFGVLYLGSTLKTCFAETILRDQRDGLVGDIDVEERELSDRYYSDLVVRNPLRLLTLESDGALRMGVPSEVAKGRSQALARR